jgi:two-component system, cell cycle sensor histidine kinase and response regulator CckA
MANPLRVLIVEDRVEDAELVLHELRRSGFDPEWQRVETGPDFMSLLSPELDVILSDYSMPQFSAPQALSLLRESGLDVPLIIITGTISEEVAVESIKLGATDYLLKDRLSRLGQAVSNALERKRARVEQSRAEEALRDSEEQLRQSQRLESVGRLAGGVAHDFNNLLTAIVGYSELTLKRLGPDDPSRRNVMEIKKAGERAASLTRQLLAFSRRQILQPKVFDLNAVVSDMEDMLRRLIGEDIDVLNILDAGLGHIKADIGQIEQVIMNLVVNARDAMPTGGKLTIETANMELSDDYARRHASVEPGRYVMLAVSDTGAGMDAETQERIFEPFFTTKEVGKGTGLGLSTVYGVVKQSGGSIWVYSEVGLGTTFKIYLPRVDEKADKLQEVMHHTAARRSSETVLLVEDEEAVRGLLRNVLESEGYRVLETTSSDAALEKCRDYEGDIHLMLTDVVMPGMSGPELAERTAGLRPRMKVIFMSGYTDESIIRHGLLDLGVEFLEKPFTPDAVAWKLRDVLDAAK